MSTFDLASILAGMNQQNRFDPAWAPTLVSFIEAKDTRETGIILLRRLFENAGRSILAPDQRARLLAAVGDVSEGAEGDKVLSLLAAWGDSSAAALTVDRMESWHDGYPAVTALSSYPRDVAGAALSARFATGQPIVFRSTGRASFHRLEALVADLGKHVTGTPLWPPDVRALEQAILEGNAKVVQELLAAGTDPNSQMFEEPSSLLITAIMQTYLDCAGARIAKARLRIVELLLEHGASTTAKLGDGPLQCRDHLLLSKDNAYTIATKLAGKGPFEIPEYRDWEFVPFDDKTYAKMEPALERLFEIVDAAHEKRAGSRGTKRAKSAKKRT